MKNSKFGAIMAMILFVIGLVVGVAGFLLGREYRYQMVEKKEDQKVKEERQQKKKNRKEILTSGVTYKEKNVKLPCKKEDVMNVFEATEMENRPNGFKTSSGTTFSLMLEEDQEQVYGFFTTSKEFSFYGICVGMSESEVVQRLGKPELSSDGAYVYENNSIVLGLRDGVICSVQLSCSE